MTTCYVSPIIHKNEDADVCWTTKDSNKEEEEWKQGAHRKLHATELRKCYAPQTNEERYVPKIQVGKLKCSGGSTTETE